MERCESGGDETEIYRVQASCGGLIFTLPLSLNPLLHSQQFEATLMFETR